VTCVDAFAKEKAISGGQDKSVRIWKVVEEKQLVFKGPSASVDCISLIDDQNFVSGSEDGSISLWSVQKKKPIFIKKQAHSNNLLQKAPLYDPLTPWITSIAACKHSDMIASGSYNGLLNLWKVEEGLSLVASIPVVGFINAIVFSRHAKFLIAGIGQEHRLGRWSTVKDARNSLKIIPLPTSG